MPAGENYFSSFKGAFMSWQEIKKIEKEISEQVVKLESLRKQASAVPVKNYTFQTPGGKISLLDMFGKKDKLIVIHNMGQGCRFCTSWADAINGSLAHVESAFSVYLVSKDPVDVQRNFALSRQWGFQMASHGGGEYIQEQSVEAGEDNMPGIVCYERKGDQIFRKNSSAFGPGDLFNPLFHIVSLGGIGLEEFTPQYSYWRRPEKMDDGGQNLI